MFVEITQINSYGEEGKSLIRVEDIIGIKELHTETKKLYDEDGNVVSEEQTPRMFQVLVVSERNTKETFVVGETQYQTLVDLLTK